MACGGDDEPTKPANKQPQRTVLAYFCSSERAYFCFSKIIFYNFG